MTKKIALTTTNQSISAKGGEFSFQQIVDNAFEGIYVIDSQSQTIYVNQRMCEMLGYREQEILKHKVSDFMYPEDLVDHEARIKARSQNIAEQYERRFRRKDGREAWFLISAQPRFSEEGEFLGSFAHFVDISRQKDQDRQLQVIASFNARLAVEENVEHIYQLIGETIHQLIPESIVGTSTVIDSPMETKVVSIDGVSPVFLALSNKYAIDPAKLTFSLKEMSPLAERAFFSQKLLRYEEGIFPLLMRRLSPEICAYAEKMLQINHIFIMGLVNEGKRLGGVIILAKEDVAKFTETVETIVQQAAQVIKRLNSEKMTKISEDRLAKTFEAIKDGYWDWDIPSGNIIVNDHWYTMLGYQPYEFPATYENFVKLIHPDDLHKAVSLIDEVRKNCVSDYVNEFRLRTKSGDYRVVNSRGKILTTSRGNTPIRMVGIHSDITEHTQMEHNRKLFYETQRQLLQISDLQALYDLVGNCLIKLVKNGFAIFTRFDDPETPVKITGSYGFEKVQEYSPENLLTPPKKQKIRINDNTPEEIHLWENNTLTRYNGGVYELLKKRVSKKICRDFETKCGIREIFVMGAQYNNHQYGGFILLTQNGLGHNKELIETLINESSIAVQRILTEEKAREAQNRYRDIFESSPVGIVTVGADFKYLSANHEFCNFCGYSEQELFNMTFVDVTHPDDVENNVENIRKLLAGEIDVYNVVKKYVRKDGSVIWGKALINKICDQQGNFLYMLGMITDITREIHAEQAIAENQRFQEIVLNAIPNWVFVRDNEGYYRLVNKAFADAVGAVPEEIVGKTDLDLGGDSILYGKLRQQDQEILINRKIWINNDMQMTLPDKSTRPVQFVKLPLPDTANKKPAILGVITDISEIKKYEQQLLDKEVKYRTLFESMRQGAIYLLADGTIQDVNSAALEIFGVSREELQEWCKKLPSLVVKDEAGNILDDDSRPILRARRTGQAAPEKILCIYNPRKGHDIWVVVDVIPQFHENEAAPYQFYVTVQDITELKIIERELRVSELRYRTLIQNMPAGVYQTDDVGRNVYYNDQFCELSGMAHKEMLGDGWINSIFDVDRERVVKSWDEYLKKGGRWSIEYRIKNQRTGQITWVIDEANELLGDGGKRIGFIGFRFDLNRIKDAEEKLRQSEEKYRLLTENMKDVVWILDTETLRFTYMSPSVYSLRGFTAEEVLQQPLSAALIQEDFEKLSDIITNESIAFHKEGYPSDKFYVIEISQPHKDGSSVWSEVIASLHMNPQTGHLDLHGVTRDISARKKIENELQKSDEKHRLLIENSHDIIYTLSTSGEITFISKACKLLLGYSASEMTGRPALELLHPDDHRNFNDFMRNIVNSNSRQVGIEYRIKHADGSWRWHTSSAVQIYEKNGKCIGIEGISRDITEQKKAEEALLESEERYRILVENSPVGIFLIRKDEFYYANDAGLKLLGLKSSDELTGRRLAKSIHPDSLKILQGRISGKQREGTDSAVEITIIQENGSIRHAESTTSKVKINGETITLIFGQDITNRKMAEIKIRKNAEDLSLMNRLNESANRGDTLVQSLKLLNEETKKIFLGNGAAVYFLDSDKKHLELQSFQLKPELIAWIEKTIGMKIPKVRMKISPDGFYQKILTEKKLQYIEGSENIMNLMKEFTGNRIFHRMIPAIYKRMEINSVIGIPLIVQNESVGILEFSSNNPLNQEDLRRFEFISSELSSIIRRRQAEEALKESEVKFRQIVESSNDIFLRQNFATLNFEYVSPKIYDLLGFQPSEILEMDHHEVEKFIHPDDLGKFNNLRQDVLSAHQNDHGSLMIEFRLHGKQGSYKWFTSNYSLVVDEENNPKMIICTLADVTERKQNEQSLNFRLKLMQLAPKVSLNELFAAILDEVCAITDSPVGYYFLVDKDEHSISRLAWSSRIDQTINLTFLDKMTITDLEKSFWMNYCQNREPLIRNANDPENKGIPHEKSQTTLLKELVVPLIRGGKIVSVLGVANKAADYTREDCELMSILADLIWGIVKNKSIEDALRESEAIFSALMENSPFYVFFKDKELRAKHLSRNYEAWLGHPLDHLLQHRLEEFFPPDIGQKMSQEDAEILLDGKTCVVEEEWNGHYYTMIKFPIFKDGKPELLAGFTIDNTDRILSEQKLAESEEMYRLISSLVSDYLYSTQVTEGDHLEDLWVAGAFEKITGYNLAEYHEIGGWRATVHPEDLELDNLAMQDLHENKKVVSEVRTIHKNGEIVWVRSYAQPVWDEKNNKLIGINGAVQDITERKKAEEEIKKSAREFEALYDTAKDFSMHRDPIVILRTISDRACSLFDVSNAFVYFYDPDAKELELKFTRNSKEPIGMRLKLGEGISGTVAERLTPIIVDDYHTWPNRLNIMEGENFGATMCVPMLYGGQLMGVLGVQELNSSKHRFTESDAHFLSLFASQAAGAVYSAALFEQLRNNAADLEKRVNERTLELQAKNKELETFTYTVSHDLKAPLRGISGYSSLLMEDYSERLDEEGKRYLQNLVNSTERMNQLIEDLLVYSRIERREIKRTAVNINSLIDKIIVEYLPEMKTRNLEFKKEIEYDTLFTDIEAITQALRNLIDNAVKFTKDREAPQIVIRCNKMADHYLISVEDNGIGFDMKYYDKIFEIFQRLHLAEDFPGTGVGLAVVRKAIERLNGKIWAVSEPGVGSTFFMELPL